MAAFLWEKWLQYINNCSSASETSLGWRTPLKNNKSYKYIINIDPIADHIQNQWQGEGLSCSVLYFGTRKPGCDFRLYPNLLFAIGQGMCPLVPHLSLVLPYSVVYLIFNFMLFRTRGFCSHECLILYLCYWGGICEVGLEWAARKSWCVGSSIYCLFVTVLCKWTYIAFNLQKYLLFLFHSCMQGILQKTSALISCCAVPAFQLHPLSTFLCFFAPYLFFCNLGEQFVMHVNV